MNSVEKPSVSSRSLAGLRAFVVEDEGMVTLLIEELLEELGCTVVGTAATLDDAMEQVRTLEFDVALLDINLNGTRTDLVASELIQRQIPFVFATGYGMTLGPQFSNAQVLAKPFRSDDLERALHAVWHPRLSN